MVGPLRVSPSVGRRQSLCLRAQRSYGAGTAVGSVGIAIDRSGNIGVYYEYGVGAAAGGEGSVGVAIHGANAQDIYDLQGPFHNGSIGAGEVVAGSIDGFTVDSDHGRVIGGGVTVGAGLGVGGSVTRTTTVIPYSINIGKTLSQFGKAVNDFVDETERGACKIYGCY